MPVGNPRIDDSRAPLICGSDEAGLGAWAGPLVVAAVMVPREWVPPAGLTDSKKLSPARREALYEVMVKDPSVRWRVVRVSPPSIDRTGVYRANITAHLTAHQDMADLAPDALHVADGNLPLAANIVSLPKADALVAAVSAASVIAKVTRDREMVLLGQQYKGFGFEKHMGYGTPAHEGALVTLGPCPMHRMSYAPVKARQRVHTSLLDLLDELPQE